MAEVQVAMDAIDRMLRNFRKDSKDRHSLSYFTSRLSDLKEEWSTVKKYHVKVHKQLTGSDLIEYQARYERTEETFLQLRDIFNDKIMAYQASKEGQESKLPPAVPQSMGIKLPRVDIPKFDGRFEHWTQFHDLFSSLVHKNESISTTEKFHFLKQAVTGNAANLIKHINFGGENYEAAWAVIVERFHNNRLLVNTYIRMVLTQPAMDGSAKSIERVLNTTQEAIITLQSLEQPVDQWGAVLVHICESKMDHDTRTMWELELKGTTTVPSMKSMQNFLKQRLLILESSGSHRGVKQSDVKARALNSTTNAGRFVKQHGKGDSMQNICPVCKLDHFVFQCTKFKSSTIPERRELAKQRNLCFRCLREGHQMRACKTKWKCRECQATHHTWLHEPKRAEQDAGKLTVAPALESLESKTVANARRAESNSIQGVNTTLLPTARVIVKSNGKTVALRVLLDQGSQENFITRRAVRQLNLTQRKTCTQVQGIGNGSAMVHGRVSFNISSIYGNSQMLNVNALVMDNIVDDLPTLRIVKTNWEHLNGLSLADPDYHVPTRIDILLGAAQLSQLILPGVVMGPPGAPIAQETALGWILSGGVQGYPRSCLVSQSQTSWEQTTSENNLNDALKRFWEWEEISVAPKLAKEEHECEVHYSATYRRNSDGKFIVQLPLKHDPSTLGASHEQATKRLLALERRLTQKASLYREYQDVMQGYLDQRHMELVPKSELNKNVSYYLPHHPVIKESSSTTKVRVVFDASAKTSTGWSLNDIIKVGPVVQKDLYTLLIQWRFCKYVFTADIRCMYRQIWLEKSQWDLQRILWRNSPKESIKTYRLKTVTFGTASAPYLATKTINQLAEDECNRYPIGSKVLMENFYVDDLLGGADTLAQCKISRDEVISLLKEAGFEIRQWAASSPEVLQGMPSESIRIDEHSWLSSETNEVKTLGVQWCSASDVFKFKAYSFGSSNKFVPTKRQITSEAAQVFDPLGWLAPVVVTAKIMLQQLWLQQVGWDDEVSPHMALQWEDFRKGLGDCVNIRVPRWVNLSQSMTNMQIHAFSDASEKAYAVCIYLRITDEFGVHVSLLTAKTRVAPIKKITLPRLELCGATLLSRLVDKIVPILPTPPAEVHAWIDSTIVLDWIQQPPHKWKTYVANRVSEIHENTHIKLWHHVKTKENPADLATRGVKPHCLLGDSIWWHGPDWLKLPATEWPKARQTTHTQLEARRPEATMFAVNLEGNELISRYSDMGKLLTITAWCRRWKYKQIETYVTASERRNAEKTLIKVVQRERYSTEITALTRRNPISKSSKLLELSPMLDSDGILRVGGRLANAKLGYDQRHNIILPSNHHFTNLLIDKVHLETLHGGTQLTLSCLRRKYWIVKGRQAVKYRLHRCITCLRHRQEGHIQLMGNLPKNRVNPSKPFQCVGIDYAGPLDIRRHKGRGAKSEKMYIAVFVCFTTKAIHLELVSDLTGEGLIAAIRRFTARRGVCTDIYSDNGRNMIGASRQLERFNETIKQSHKDVESKLAREDIAWHFIPPRAPHFGGLWESAVKSTKYHLKRIMGNTTFTIEEMHTALCQIEGCLNSRPLCGISDDPEDEEILTPNHFLLGHTSVMVPDNSPFTKSELTRRWNLVQEKVHQFWKVWSSEYLSTLHSRNKWKQTQPNAEIGQLVIIKDACAPPAKWSKGIIINTFPGDDGLVRVADVKTQDGVVRRPTTKLCLLPLQQESKKKQPVMCPGKWSQKPN